MLLTLIASGLYVAAGGTLALRLARRPEPDHLLRPGLWLALAAVVLHAVPVWTTTWVDGGLNLSFFNAAALVGWLMNSMLLLAVLRRPVENLGVILLPATGLVALLSLVLGRESVRSAPLGGVDVHVLLSMLAYSVLGLAAVQAILLSAQERKLRRHHPGGFVRKLPPLAAMESTLFDLLAAGFALLTLALISGAVFVEDLFAQHLVHKTVLTSLAWLLFGVLLWGRLRHGWRGQTAARWTLGGFVALMLGYFGSKFVLELVLGR
jgi:ABC-type uncharacterized transport system permease subunit